MATSLLMVLACTLVHAHVTSYEALDYDSVADPAAVVTRGSARFTTSCRSDRSSFSDG